jgi:hypothetical protein
MTDVVELIVAEHRRICRLFAALDHAASHPPRLHPYPAGPVWARLAELLLLHADAEEEICFLPMFALAEHGSEQMHEAIADLDDIREAVAEAALHCPGSPAWQAAVLSAGCAAEQHCAAIEHGALPALRCGLTRQQRAQLARQWAGFTAARIDDAMIRAAGRGAAGHEPYRPRSCGRTSAGSHSRARRTTSDLQFPRSAPSAKRTPKQ